VLKKEQEAVDKALLQAAKANEVARCYPVYERLKREAGFLDYADLITQTVALLEAHADVRAILQAEYPHVLADEYQDVNRASAKLVRLLAGDEASGLWAVGDSRQSIYQFQGASPANVAAFARDYPGGKRQDLGINYRSRSAIVSLFGEAARQMDGLPAEANMLWHAHRGVSDTASFPAVTWAAAPDVGGQADGIARTARTLEAAGQALKEQAVLCRTHGQAEALSEALAARRVPNLYLGPLLERPEIKDLLCLLALLAEAGGTALVRVGAWPEYAVPRSDVLTLLGHMAREETTLLEALSDPNLHPGLCRLGQHLAELETLDNDPADLLRCYLFGQSRFLRDLAARTQDPFARRTQGLAIHQLLALATGAAQRLVVSPHAGPPHPVRDFLAHLRRRTASGETLRVSLPEEADDWDAMRLLTAHAAKGLEYPVVFLPHLSAGHFPTRGRSDGLVAPPGLIDRGGTAEDDAETDEEQCLFFVALSRAHEHLILCRAETYNSARVIPPTEILALIQPGLAALGLSEEAWPSGNASAEAEDAEEWDTPPATLPEYSSSALEMYLRCPRQYHYKYALKLPGGYNPSGYPQFVGCVRRVLDWLEDARAQNLAPTEDEILAHLDTLWEEVGPVGHLHEARYKDSARTMLCESARLGSPTETRTDSRTLRATLTHCHVFVRPDALRRDTADGTLIAARHLTGRVGADDHTGKRLALYRRAATQTHPTAPIRIELRYLAHGECKVVAAPETKQQIKWETDRVEKYDQAARGIARGRFPAKPASGDECGNCPYALICPE
nr:ATP-dependent helicase [Armatimonadota bacterium]